MSQLLEDIRTAIPARYSVEREIGHGGMATVFVADDTHFGRRVAIKVLNPDLGSSLNADRFAREIRVLAQLNHPNILPVLDSGESNGLLFYVMPFIEGESLGARLAREHQFALDEAVAITCEIADALSYAHGHGIVHRDVKPENVLLSDGHAIVADFGIARLLNDDGTGKITMTGISVGTAAYMSPEQSTGEKVDARADIYSLGCLLYELLVGAPPFTGPNPMALMARHAMEPPPSIRVVRPAVPEEVEAAIMHALEKAPVDRYRSVAEFKATLLGEAGATSPGRYTTPYTARFTAIHGAVRPSPAATLRRILGAGSVLVAAAGLAFYFRQNGLLGASDGLPENAARVAVTYFTDAPGSGLQYLADAITENLVERLDEAELDVASVSAVREFRGASVAADSIGRALGVGTLVRGSLEPAGKGVRVTVQLWDAVEDREIDRTAFQAEGMSAVQLQGEVVSRTADLIRERLGRRLDLREQALGTTSEEAWTRFRRAELRRKDADSLVATGDPRAALASLDAADSLLAVAERMDRSWAAVPTRRAMVALARARATRAAATLDKQPADATLLTAIVDGGLAEAARALALAPLDADALNAKGDLLHFKYNYRLAPDPATAERVLAEAESALVRSVRIDGTQAEAWSTLSAIYYRRHDMQGVVHAAFNALRADKYLVSARLIQSRLFYAQYNTEDFAGARMTCDEGRRRFPADPAFTQCRLFLYMTPRAGAANPDSAWIYAARLVELSPAAGRELAQRRASVLVAGALVAAGMPDSARQVLGRARPDPGLDPQRTVIGWEAAVRLMLGEKDTAVDLLREYLAVNPDHRPGFVARTSWWWRGIQDHAPFRALIGS